MTADLDSTTVANLYQYGMLADSLRETCRQLLGARVTDATVQELSSRYTALRDKIADVVPQDRREDVLTWAPARTPGSDVAWTFYAAASLGTVVDTLLGSDAFVAAQQVRTAQAVAAAAHVHPTPPAQAASGQYL